MSLLTIMISEAAVHSIQVLKAPTIELFMIFYVSNDNDSVTGVHL